jgi:hypothetical protein
MGARGAAGLGHGREPAGSPARLCSGGKTGGSCRDDHRTAAGAVLSGRRRAVVGQQAIGVLAPPRSVFEGILDFQTRFPSALTL